MSHDQRPEPPSIVVIPHCMPGSPAVRFGRLLDLYAPETEQLDGSIMRDPTMGIISRDDFVRLLDASPSNGDATQPSSEEKTK